MHLPRTHAWTPLQKWLIIASVGVSIVMFGALVYAYERHHRGPGDEVLYGTWADTGTTLCFHFYQNHTFYITGCDQPEVISHGRWYAGGPNIYLSLSQDASDLVVLKRPVVLHILDIQRDTLSLALSRDEPALTFRRVATRD